MRVSDPIIAPPGQARWWRKGKGGCFASGSLQSGFHRGRPGGDHHQSDDSYVRLAVGRRSRIAPVSRRLVPPRRHDGHDADVLPAVSSWWIALVLIRSRGRRGRLPGGFERSDLFPALCGGRSSFGRISRPHDEGFTRAVLGGQPERCLSLWTYLELLQCAQNRQQHRYTKSFLKDLGFHTLPLSENIGYRAAVYIEEYSLSHGLRAGDAIVAATAAEHDLTLCTSNAGHLKPIRELKIKAFKP